MQFCSIVHSVCFILIFWKNVVFLSDNENSRGHHQDYSNNDYNNTPTRGYNKNYKRSLSPSQQRRGYQWTQQYNHNQYVIGAIDNLNELHMHNVTI